MDVGVIGRDEEVARLVDHLGERRAGPVVISGPPGIGKTTVVGTVSDQLEGRGWIVERTNGVPAGSGFPFAPFAHLLDGEAPAATETEQLARLRASLTGGDRPRLLVVDDAHLLDPASLVLVHQLGVREELRLLLSVRSTEPVPADVAAVGSLPSSRWESIGPLDREHTEVLVERLAGGRVHPTLHDEVWRLTAGTPFYVRDLVAGALESGAVERDESGQWVSQGRLVPPARLTDALGRRFDRLGDAAPLVSCLAVTRILPRSWAVGLVGADGVRSCLASGIVTRFGGSPDRGLGFAHDLYADAAMERLDPLERADLIDRLLDLPTDGDDVLADHLVTRVDLALAARRAVVDEVRLAAEVCLNRFDLARALRYIEWVIATDARPLDVVLHSMALLRLDRAAEAAERVRPALTEGEPEVRARVAFFYAYALLTGGDPEASVTILREAIDGLPAEVTIPLRSCLANIHFYTGDPQGSIELAEPILALTGGVLPLDAVGVVSSWAILGQPQRSIDQIRAVWPPEIAEDDLALSAAMLSLMNLLWIWQLANLQVGALGRFDTTMAGLEPDTGALWRLLSGTTLFNEGLPATLDWLRGRLDRASLGHRSVEGRQRRGPVQVATFHYVSMATLEACRGDVSAAQAAMAMIDEYPEGSTAGFRWWVERAEVAVLAAEGRVAEAVDRSIELADRYAIEHFHATTSIHDVVRYGSASLVVGRARAQAARDGATWWDRVCADHAVAASECDAAGLLHVSDRFAEGGLALEALEAAAQSARLGGRCAIGTAANGRIVQLTSICGRVRTPALVVMPMHLTEREHVVACMAAQGQTNKDIAQRLGTSARTVGNQLQSVYQKLGVSSRHELAPLVD